MTDAERVLNLLIHDLRTPLGVAHGYLRLIREQRLTTTDDRERALVGTQQALGRISRLCEEASAFLASPGEAAQVRASGTLIVDRVVAQLRGRGIEPRQVAAEAAGRVTMRVGAGVERLAEAVTTVLATTAGESGSAVRIETEGAELRFVAAAETPPRAGAVPFDPWRGHGLAIPLACRLVESVGGRVASEQAGALTIVFPVEIASE
jgi:signal transduction histidine kinase